MRFGALLGHARKTLNLGEQTAQLLPQRRLLATVLRAHDKDVDALCRRMEPDYHQLEFDVRLWLPALPSESRQVPAP